MASPFRIVLLQAVAIVTAGASFAVWDLLSGAVGLPQARGAALGGAVSLGPTALYAWQATRERSAARFLLQGVVKFLATLGLMAAAIALFRPPAAGFFVTLVATQLMYVIGPLTERSSGAAAGPPGAGAGDDRSGN